MIAPTFFLLLRVFLKPKIEKPLQSMKWHTCILCTFNLSGYQNCQSSKAVINPGIYIADTCLLRMGPTKWSEVMEEFIFEKGSNKHLKQSIY